MATNPYYQPNPPPLSLSMRAALGVLVSTYLQASATLPTIPDAVLQAAHPLLGNPAVWALIKSDLGLS